MRMLMQTLARSTALIAALGATSGAVLAANATPFETASARLGAAATRLEDAEAVKRLQRAYGFYLDKGYWQEAADLFADDATYESGVDGVYVGKARILKRIELEGGGTAGPGLPYGRLNNRMQLQPVIHVAPDGRSARGRWRELALLGQFQQYAAWEEGVYENEYVKQGDIWKIRSLHYYPNFHAPYESGWARLTPVSGDWASAVAKQLPADRPPTQRYAPFPRLFVPPFHYDSPLPALVDLRPALALSSGAAAAQLQALRTDAARIARLQSRAAIENLQAAYGYYIDKGLWRQAAALFSRAGTYEFGGRGVYVGRQHIRAALGLFGREGLEPGQLNNYMMLQPVVDVAADNQTAKARWRSDVQLSRAGRGQWGGGVYENEYVNEEGTWRISKLHFYVTFLADYDSGWIEGSVPLDGPSASTPPDRPPTEHYESLPGVYAPAYHYANPVTGAPAEVAVAAGASDPNTPLQALERRIVRLEDIAAVEKLQRCYGYYVDKARWSEVADLFADNGTLEIGGRGIFVGKPRVLEYLVKAFGPGAIETRRGQLLDHQQFQGIVTISADGSTAAGRWAAFVMGGGPKPGAAVWGDVTYENRYVKERGVWKIAHLHAPFNMYSFYKPGWAHQAVVNTLPGVGAPPPDLPPSVVYLTYPNFYVAPFHFPNPVTGHVAAAPLPSAGGLVLGP
jgi:hypothetical protein